MDRSCHSISQIPANGKLVLSEKWQWLNRDKLQGKLVVAEM